MSKSKRTKKTKKLRIPKVYEDGKGRFIRLKHPKKGKRVKMYLKPKKGVTELELIYKILKLFRPQKKIKYVTREQGKERSKVRFEDTLPRKSLLPEVTGRSFPFPLDKLDKAEDVARKIEGAQRSTEQLAQKAVEHADIVEDRIEEIIRLAQEDPAALGERLRKEHEETQAIIRERNEYLNRFKQSQEQIKNEKNLLNTELRSANKQRKQALKQKDISELLNTISTRRGILNQKRVTIERLQQELDNDRDNINNLIIAEITNKYDKQTKALRTRVKDDGIKVPLTGKRGVPELAERIVNHGKGKLYEDALKQVYKNLRLDRREKEIEIMRNEIDNLENLISEDESRITHQESPKPESIKSDEESKRKPIVTPKSKPPQTPESGAGAGDPDAIVQGSTAPPIIPIGVAVPPDEFDQQQQQEAEADKQEEAQQEAEADKPEEQQQGGLGKVQNKKGLYDDEIDHYMKKYKQYKGTYAQNEVRTLKGLLKRGSNAGVIINTEPRHVSYGHWVAVYFTPDTLEYYDSFGEDIPKNLKDVLYDIAKKVAGNNPIQVKINRIVEQRANNDNCGYHAMKFLIDRFNGKKFKEITGYSNVLQSEKKLRNFIKTIQPFRIIK